MGLHIRSIDSNNCLGFYSGTIVATGDLLCGHARNFLCVHKGSLVWGRKRFLAGPRKKPLLWQHEMSGSQTAHVWYPHSSCLAYLNTETTSFEARMGSPWLSTGSY